MNERNIWIAIAALFIVSFVNLVGIFASSSTPAANTQIITTTTTSAADRAKIEALTAQLSQMSDKVTSLQSDLSKLNKVIEEQDDKINQLKIPTIVKSKLSVPNLIVDNLAKPAVDYLKSKAGGAALFVDLSTDAVKAIIKTKLTRAEIELINATRIQGSTYNANLRIQIPIRLAEIPGASTLQAALGDITIYAHVDMAARIDTQTQTISNPTFTNAGIW